MDEPKPIPTQGGTTPERPVQADAPTEQPAIARGSGHWLGAAGDAVPPPTPDRRERNEHSVMEGLPDWKAERVAGMRRELADLQRQLTDAQQRIATELQGRADDADRFEALEAREAEAKQRITELDTELAALRSQLSIATAATEELRRDVVARDEAKTLLAKREAELATVTAERDVHQTDAAKLEQELTDQRKQHRELSEQLEEQRKQHREVSEQLDVQATSLRDANAVIATRGTELAAMTSERDTLKTALEQARRDLDAARTKTRDVAAELVRLGKDLGDGAISETATDAPAPAPKRPQPPPMPAARIAPIETILVTEEAKSGSRMRSALLLVGGLIAGCAVTFAIMKGSSANSTTAADSTEVSAASTAPLAAPVAADPPPADPMVPAETIEPSPPTPSDTAVAAQPKDESAAVPAEVAATDGVILIPQSASGRRVFVDGHTVKVKSLRAVVPCGARKVKIGSDGEERNLDIACGGETIIAEETRVR